MRRLAEQWPSARSGRGRVAPIHQPRRAGMRVRLLLRRLGQLALDLRVDTGVVQRAGNDRARDGSQLGAVGVRTGEVIALRRCDHADDQLDDDQYRPDAHRCLPCRIEIATLTRGRRRPSAFHKLGAHGQQREAEVLACSQQMLLAHRHAVLMAPSSDRPGGAPALPVVPAAANRASVDPRIHKTAPMISKMIPIVHRIAILATKPITSRTKPRMSMLLPPPASPPRLVRGGTWPTGL